MGTVTVTIDGKLMEAGVSDAHAMTRVAWLILDALEKSGETPGAHKALLRAARASINCALAALAELPSDFRSAAPWRRSIGMSSSARRWST